MEVLQYVLAIGNYLNAGTTKGNAYGFKLGYLPKVYELMCERICTFSDLCTSHT